MPIRCSVVTSGSDSHSPRASFSGRPYLEAAPTYAGACRGFRALSSGKEELLGSLPRSFSLAKCTKRVQYRASRFCLFASLPCESPPGCHAWVCASKASAVGQNLRRPDLHGEARRQEASGEETPFGHEKATETMAVLLEVSGTLFLHIHPGAYTVFAPKLSDTLFLPP